MRSVDCNDVRPATMYSSVISEHTRKEDDTMMRMRPGEKEQVYGYRLRNYFNGEILAERQFESREAMQTALAEDLSPDNLLGSVFKTLEAGKQD